MSRQHILHDQRVIPCLFAAGIGAMTALHAPAATPIYDWLQLAPGSTTATFQLLDDELNPAVGGGATVTQGFPFPGPDSFSLDSAFWTTAMDFEDSVTGSSTVPGFVFRVAPSGGAASYSIEFSLTSGVPYVLMIADMFRAADGATTGATLTTSSDSGAAAINHLGATAWNNGIRALDQPVAWDPSSGTLSTVPGADGESIPAFFLIEPSDGTNPNLRIEIPQAYAIGSGDAIIFGLAVVVPEPSSLLMILASAGLLARRRRPA